MTKQNEEVSRVKALKNSTKLASIKVLRDIGKVLETVDRSKQGQFSFAQVKDVLIRLRVLDEVRTEREAAFMD